MEKIDNSIIDVQTTENTTWRQVIKSYIEKRVKELEKKILDNVGESLSDKKYNQHDLWRERRKVYIEFTDLSKAIKEYYNWSVITVKHE